jgi:hypothetical protein
MNITVEIREVYGQSKIYPVCDEAKIFADIAGTTTLLPRDIQRIQMLGFEVLVKQKELKL